VSIRVAPFPARSFPTREAAKRYELELLLRRSQGDRFVEESRTLGDEITSWLFRWRAGAAGRDRTREFYERSAKVWAPFFLMRLSDLRRASVEDFITARAAEHRRSARNELEFLKRVLRDAKGRGQRIDETLFTIPAIRDHPREGRALTVAELQELASWFPEHSRRLILLAGMIGARQRVWFELTEDLIDVDAALMTVPAALAKNRRDHVICLTSVEVRLFKEHLLARASGTRLVFPTPTGRQWTRSGFRERVWMPAVEAASRFAGAGSVFERLTFHLLRHTAGSLMARAGIDPAAAAERLGHTDGGALFLRKYRHLYEGEKRVHAMRLESFVLEPLDGSWTAEPNSLEEALSDAVAESGRTWDRTRDLPRVKRALSR
jgi:integrase